MKHEDAANKGEFAGKVLHHVGRSDPPALLTLPPYTLKHTLNSKLPMIYLQG